MAQAPARRPAGWVHEPHLGLPIPSPAVMEKIGTAFRRRSARSRNRTMPVVQFASRHRKIEVMRPHVAAAKAGRSGAAAIGVAQEFQNVFASSERNDGSRRCGSPSTKPTGGHLLLLLSVGRAVRARVHQDLRLLPLSGQGLGQRSRVGEAAATLAGIGFSELSNGFATCDDPAELQAICDRLGPSDIDAFFDRWMAVLPVPLTDADRAAGYWWELSMRQVETSRTMVFDAPRRARSFFEALVVDNLDLGRPDHVEVIFAGHPRPCGRPPKSSRSTRPGSTPATPSGSP